MYGFIFQGDYMKLIKAQLFTLAVAVLGSSYAAGHNNLNSLFSSQINVPPAYTCGVPPSETNDNQVWCRCQYNYNSSQCIRLAGGEFCKVDKTLRFVINERLGGVDNFCAVHYRTKSAQCALRLHYYMKNCPLQNL